MAAFPTELPRSQCQPSILIAAAEKTGLPTAAISARQGNSVQSTKGEVQRGCVGEEDEVRSDIRHSSRRRRKKLEPYITNLMPGRFGATQHRATKRLEIRVHDLDRPKHGSLDLGQETCQTISSPCRMPERVHLTSFSKESFALDGNRGAK